MYGMSSSHKGLLLVANNHFFVLPSTTMFRKTTKRIQNKDDYEASSFKDIVEDMEDTKDKALDSLPKIRKEQVPTKDETTGEILYGDSNHNNNDE